jgi:hypothetical protein
MDSIKDSVEKVVSESQTADDVTDQFIDLEARLTNLEALEVELRALLTEVRQQPEADPDKLLRVFNEIANVRGQIEQIQGQLDYLEDVVDLATLSIGLTPTPAVVPIADDTWEPVEVARDALRNLVTGFQGVADWAIGFALYTLPMLLILLGVPGLVGLRSRRQNGFSALGHGQVVGEVDLVVAGVLDDLQSFGLEGGGVEIEDLLVHTRGRRLVGCPVVVPVGEGGPVLAIEDVVHEGKGGARMLGVGGDRHVVDPERRPLLGEDVLEVIGIPGLADPDDHVAGVAMGNRHLAGHQHLVVLVGVE